MAFDRNKGSQSTSTRSFGKKLGDLMAWKSPPPGMYVASVKSASLGSVYGTKEGLHLVFDIEQDVDGAETRGRVKWSVELESPDCGEFLAALIADADVDYDAELTDDVLRGRRVVFDLAYREYQGREFPVLTNFQSAE